MGLREIKQSDKSESQTEYVYLESFVIEHIAAINCGFPVQ